VIFARNFGHQLAVTAGLDYSRGRAVVIIDSDLQDPPEVIPELIAQWRQGYEVVYAVRTEREGETWFKLFTASLFYRLIYRITDVNIPLDTGDFRLLDRKVVDVINKMRERHRFLRGMSVWVGFRQTGVPYKRAARFAGETKYPLKKMIKFAGDAITGFSYLPLQLATYLGFIAAGLSILAIPVVVAARMAGSQAFFGQATTLIAVLFLGGVQLISLGILGEYIGRIYDEARGRPLYIVREDPESFEDRV
jgi:dolichol-phosphate mannosyltransferase